VRERLCGADGVELGFGVTEPDALELEDVPLAFVAVIVNVYDVPLTNVPVTVIGLDVPLYVRVIEGLEVIVTAVKAEPPVAPENDIDT